MPAHPKLPLGDLADIQTGYTLRDRVEHDPLHGNVYLIHLKDTKDYTLDTTLLHCIHLPKPPQQHLLQKGDILFRPRGLEYGALVLKDLPGPTLAINPLIRIRPNTNRLAPGYLLWALTNPQAQHYYHTHSAGTLIKAIAPNFLRSLPLSLPPLETQQHISRLHQLAQQEHQLLQRLSEIRLKSIQWKLQSLAGNTKPKLLPSNPTTH